MDSNTQSGGDHMVLVGLTAYAEAERSGNALCSLWTGYLGKINKKPCKLRLVQPEKSRTYVVIAIVN